MPFDLVQNGLLRIQRELLWLVDVIDVLSIEELKNALEDIERKVRELLTLIE